jgi:hypothetical protein
MNMRTGSKNVVAEVVTNTRLTTNTWSDAAREAAVQARGAHTASSGQKASFKEDREAMKGVNDSRNEAKAASKTAANASAGAGTAQGHWDAAEAHGEAAGAHRSVANDLYGKGMRGHQEHQAAASAHQSASNAHRGMASMLSG